MTDETLKERFATKWVPTPIGCWRWSAGTQAEVGRMFGVTASHVSRLVNGNRRAK